MVRMASCVIVRCVDGQNGQLCGCVECGMVRMASCVIVRLCGWSEWPVVWLCGVWDGQNGQLCDCEVVWDGQNGQLCGCEVNIQH